jgi:hypothetical protein
MLWTATGDAQRCQAPTEIRGQGVCIRLSCRKAGEFDFTSRLLVRASPHEPGPRRVGTMSSGSESRPEVRMIELKQIEDGPLCSGMFHGFGYKCDVEPGGGMNEGSAFNQDRGLRP